MNTDMAMLVDFRKTAEDSTRIEYQFGYPEMNRTLVIDKATLTGQPMDALADPAYSAVLSKILRLHRTQARWPEQGSFAA
jgi:hypothetical protein